MAIDGELRRRVERILSDNFDIEDLNRIFLGLRDRFFARQAFLEVGNFTAHADERTRGLVTQRAKDTYSYFRFRIPLITDPNAVSYTGKEVADALRANLRLFDDDMIGVRREVALSMLGKIERKLSLYSNGCLRTTAHITDKENRLIESLNSRLISKPAFTGPELVDDVVHVLIRNRLLDASEIDNFTSASRAIQLYGAWRMHNCTILLGDNDVADLRGGLEGEYVSVDIRAVVKKPSGENLVSIPMYTTDLLAEDCCDPDMLNATWTYPLALTPDWRLTRL